jgi:hypothetical protein
VKLEIVIPSHARPRLAATAAALFPDPLICVARDEEKSYRGVLPRARIIAHPNIKGLPNIRQWIMDTVKADAVFMVDDDIYECRSLVPMPPHQVEDPEAVFEIVRNCALNAREAGTICFWFLPKSDPRIYHCDYPFQLTGTYKGWVQGFWRKEFNEHIRFDSNIKIKANIDVSLRIARRYKFLWCDCRYAFNPAAHMNAAGGLSSQRTEAALEADYAYLRKKFGAVIQIDHKAKLENKIRLRPRRK